MRSENAEPGQTSPDRSRTDPRLVPRGSRSARAVRVVLGIILLGGLGLGASPGPVDAAREQVSGKGRFVSGTSSTYFEFRASGGPGRANGFVRLVHSVDGEVVLTESGTVTCLKVRGDRMVIAGKVTSGPSDGTYFVFRAEDNGRHPRQPRDHIAGASGYTDPISCATYSLSGDLDAHRITRGDIKIS